MDFIERIITYAFDELILPAGIIVLPFNPDFIQELIIID